MTHSPPQPEIITRLFDAVYPSFAMLAGMELDLFTPLKNGPMTLEQLAGAIGVQAIKLRPLLYALVVGGLLTVEDDLFANTVEADHFLVRGKPTYLGGLHELTSSNWSRMIKTAGTIRAGKPIETHDYHSMSQREQVGLFRGLYPGTLADAERVMDQHDFSTCSTLLDVGGGSGGLAITIAQANPDLKATVIDLPFVTPITRQFVEEAGAADRVEIITGNAVHDPLPGSYDVIVARHVVQVLSGDDSCILLDNLAAALSPGGVIFLVGWTIFYHRATPDIDRQPQHHSHERARSNC